MTKRAKALVAATCLVIPAAIAISSCLGYGAGDFLKPKLIVGFRFDDYSSRSPTDVEEKLIRLFEQHQVPCTFAVIPFVTEGDPHDPTPVGELPLPAHKGDILRSAIDRGFINVALHGYSHRTIRREDNTEFSGLDANEQRRRIADGKAFLEKVIGSKVDMFVPPWNSYDSATLAAVEDSGIRCFSAEEGGPGISNRLRSIPATCPLTKLRSFLDQARHCRDPEPVFVVLFHVYDLKESNDRRAVTSLSEVGQLLDWLTAQKDIHLASLPDIAFGGRNKQCGDQGAAFKAELTLSHILPRALAPQAASSIPSRSVNAIVVEGVMLFLVYYGLILLGSFLLSSIIMVRLSARSRIRFAATLRYMLPALLIAITAMAVASYFYRIPFARDVMWEPASLISLGTGLWVGVLL